ncbi:MAG: hypothetical protein ACO1QR_00385 [Chthoniobacteraceae bacterium]
MFRFLHLSALLLVLAVSAQAAQRPFDLHKDTFAFSNDTALLYGIDERGDLQISRREKPADFAHRCFILSRSVMQFRQFARFAPKEPKVSREEYRRRLLKLNRIPVWSRGPKEKIVFPGFADLRSFSIAYEGLLKENLGNWFATYMRVGNYRMMMPHPRSGQAAGARWLLDSMAQGELRAVYLSRFPKMNHVVVVYRGETLPNGDIRFLVYDPNYPSEPTPLDFSQAEKSFSFPRRWYFPGGRVNLMRVYISPIH